MYLQAKVQAQVLKAFMFNPLECQELCGGAIFTEGGWIHVQVLAVLFQGRQLS